MLTFVLGLVILIGGGALYGALCQKVFSPDDRKTPAYTKNDGVDYVPMSKWKNSLINLLNIAGTGPILGPIQGILFGPIAFITIPIGCVIGGAMHDYFTGMISVREGGIQMPEMIKMNTIRFIRCLYVLSHSWLAWYLSIHRVILCLPRCSDSEELQESLRHGSSIHVYLFIILSQRFYP